MVGRQALFMFSPDGGTSVYTFSPSGKAITYLLGALAGVLVCVSLALVELAHLVSSAFMFLLTANGDVLTRLGGFAVFILLMVACLTAFQYVRLRSANLSAGATV
jgi:hypothetical protein